MELEYPRDEEWIDLSLSKLEGELHSIKNEIASDMKLKVVDLLNFCTKNLFKMKSEVIENLEKGLRGYSTKIEVLPSQIKTIRGLRHKLQQSIELVDHLIKLKKCHEGFKESLNDKNYELCAKFIEEYLPIRKSCIKFEETICSDLDKGRDIFYNIVCDLFDQSLNNGNQEGVFYYVRLFVPLGKSQEGLRRYITFIRGNISDLCMKKYNNALKDSQIKGSKLDYVDIFTSLFISIANTIQDYQGKIPDFAKYDTELEDTSPFNDYKKRSTMLIFYRGIEEELYIQENKLIDRFEKDHKLYLDIEWNDPDIKLEDLGISHRELDEFLDKYTLISRLHYQFQVYFIGIINSCQISEMDETENCLSNVPKDSSNNMESSIEQVFSRIQDLNTKYVSCEYGYLLFSIYQALKTTDEVLWNDRDTMVSTFVEDSFFLLHKSLSRCMSIGDVNALKIILNYINYLLQDVIKPQIIENFQNAKPLYEQALGNSNDEIINYNLSHLMTLIQQTQEQKQISSNIGARYSWSHSLNNLQACIENIEILKETILRDFEADYQQLLNLQNGLYHEIIEIMTKIFKNLIAEYRQLHDYYGKITLQILSKIAISPILMTLHEDISYEITEEESRDYTLNQSFIPAMINSLQVINEHLKSYYNIKSTEYIMSLMIERVALKIEQIITNYPDTKRFTLYGALVFESDIRNLQSFTNSLLSISIRHKFSRLMEICDILNITNLEELEELLKTDFPNRNWHISKTELSKILHLKSDLDQTKVNQLIKKYSHFFS
ncbi:uncharacterized protein CMU_013810 [Cryptosporidium muris RN66]|uniref:Conserved oligomeric Golgi complex subunit 4 n=1 Tax=Cryptosporidium muris (strain RN66) TaxID=441375 RepID=B6AET9_CRYMR|nr:uncharacterized protein CMU_013810 [Cryptosporidium muris RN66]EEA06706.1 hypothetical protein, conserved [Cryptosporidium muris RN66]|eukprot:XP_002141055.1 hypothetical protein [Cryptosporidium muris RN66]